MGSSPFSILSIKSFDKKKHKSKLFNSISSLSWLFTSKFWLERLLSFLVLINEIMLDLASLEIIFFYFSILLFGLFSFLSEKDSNVVDDILMLFMK